MRPHEARFFSLTSQQLLERSEQSVTPRSRAAVSALQEEAAEKVDRPMLDRDVRDEMRAACWETWILALGPAEPRSAVCDAGMTCLPTGNADGKYLRHSVTDINRIQSASAVRRAWQMRSDR